MVPQPPQKAFALFDSYTGLKAEPGQNPAYVIAAWGYPDSPLTNQYSTDPVEADQYAAAVYQNWRVSQILQALTDHPRVLKILEGEIFYITEASVRQLRITVNNEHTLIFEYPDDAIFYISLPETFKDRVVAGVEDDRDVIIFDDGSRFGLAPYTHLGAKLRIPTAVRLNRTYDWLEQKLGLSLPPQPS